MGKFDQFKKTEAEVVNAVIDAQFDPSFISEQQVADGELATRNIRVLVLPMTLSLGKGDNHVGLPLVPTLQKFIATGGLVVTTDTPAVDEYLQPTQFPPDFVAKLVKFNDAKQNFAAAFAPAGAKPYAPMIASNGKPKKTSAIVHVLPGEPQARLLTILRAPVGQKEVIGADGVIHVEPDAEAGQEIEPLEIDIASLTSSDHPAHFYDLRGGALLAVSNNKIKLNMPHGAAFPIAVLPYSVEGMAGRATVRDRALTVTWALKSQTKTFAPHITHLEIIDTKSNRALPHFSRNVECSASGEGMVTLPLAIEDVPLSYSIHLRDILSGQEVTIAPN